MNDKEKEFLELLHKSINEKFIALPSHLEKLRQADTNLFNKLYIDSLNNDCKKQKFNQKEFDKLWNKIS